ncbi:MAG: hypothetical protein AUI36_28850, partial [Cyanobacteria bacterium 13_1_40CM_2_61_4]
IQTNNFPTRTFAGFISPTPINFVTLASPGYPVIDDFSLSPGSFQWARQFGSAGADVATHVAVNATGVYVVGFVEGALPGQTAFGAHDAFLRKYDLNGNELWTRQFGGVDADEAYGVALDGNNVFVVGRLNGPWSGQTNLRSGSAFLSKYDADGNQIWTKQFGSSGASASGLALTAAGIYVVGGQNAPFLTGFVRKFDFNGNEVWVRQLSLIFNYARAAAADASGVYMVGNVDGALAGQTSAGSSDAFVRKYDASGNEIWTRQFGTAGADSATGVAVDAGGVYVVGGTLQGAFVRKYSANGGEIWTRQLGASNDSVRGVTLDATGVYIVGDVSVALPGQ